MKFILLALSAYAAAQVQSYQPDQARAKVQAALNQTLFESVKIDGKVTDPRAEAFLIHFQNSIVPLLNRFTKIDNQQSGFGVLIDSATYKNEAEKADLNKKLEQAGTDLSAYLVDDNVTLEFAKSAELASDLKGDLPNFSRHQARERDLNAFPKSAKASLEEIQRLEARVQAALNEVPASANLEKLLQGLMSLRQKFARGEITLAKAMADSDSLLVESGDHRIGFQMVEKVGAETLNRLAILRCQLAKAKGFSNWAQYKLESSGQGYDPDFRGSRNQRAFLKSYLKKLAAEQRQQIKERLIELKSVGVKLSAHHQGFLNRPDLSLLQPYFLDPTSVWQKTMLESGFKAATLKQILMDDQPRPGKYGGGAYILPLLSPSAGILRIDATTLDIVPMTSTKPGLVYVSQNYSNAGVRDLKTVFHEGMHALNFLLAGQVLPTSETYGYLETPSTTAEHFTRDADFLFNNLKGAGELPSRPEVETLVANQIKNDSINRYTNAENALFDLELWDYDYTAPKAQKFGKRSIGPTIFTA
jgi:hypothetical protein